MESNWRWILWESGYYGMGFDLAVYAPPGFGAVWLYRESDKFRNYFATYPHAGEQMSPVGHFGITQRDAWQFWLGFAGLEDGSV